MGRNRETELAAVALLSYSHAAQHEGEYHAHSSFLWEFNAVLSQNSQQIKQKKPIFHKMAWGKSIYM
jgi:hypothetical protein